MLRQRILLSFSPCGRRCPREARADEGSLSAETDPSSVPEPTGDDPYEDEAYRLWAIKQQATSVDDPGCVKTLRCCYDSPVILSGGVDEALR